MKIPVLPESSPFNSEQRNWLNGFLAGIANVNGNNDSAGLVFSGPIHGNGLGSGSPSKYTPIPVVILFGSQSGTTEDLAQAMADRLKAVTGSYGDSIGYIPTVLGMDHFKSVNWAVETRILLLSSTWGDGEMPDNGLAFWDWLKSDQAPSLSQVSFAVLGLGDKSYSHFCQAGKNLDARFAELGGKRLLPLCECDIDYEDKSEKWINESLAALELTLSASHALPAHATFEPSLTFNNSPPSQRDATSEYSRKNPFPAPLLENHPLNAKGSSKDTRHLAFSLLGSGLEYKVGDALGVYPRNCYELVDRIILRLNCLGNESVTLDNGEPIALRAALISKLDLRHGTLRLLFNLRQACTNLGERIRLDDLIEEAGIKALPYLAERDVLDVLENFPYTPLDASQLATSLLKISPRLYSISSSPNENPGEVHLTVAVIRYTVAKRRRLGVASSFLAERVPLGMNVPVFIQPTLHFTLPPVSGLPIIMVGPGTGIAPFRAFLQERRFVKDSGKNWLFFGDQRRQFDFLYREEFVAMESSGFLTRLDFAFSRDQDEKIYVQTKMLEQSKELFEWLEAGAYFYVCGDAKRMAKDVECTLLKIIAKESDSDLEAAKAYLNRMKEQKRYQRDVY